DAFQSQNTRPAGRGARARGRELNALCRWPVLRDGWATANEVRTVYGNAVARACSGLAQGVNARNRCENRLLMDLGSSGCTNLFPGWITTLLLVAPAKPV